MYIHKTTFYRWLLKRLTVRIYYEKSLALTKQPKLVTVENRPIMHCKLSIEQM